MKMFRWGLIVFACIVIVGQLSILNYDDLSWSANSGSYLGILSMLCVIAAMYFSNRFSRD